MEKENYFSSRKRHEAFENMVRTAQGHHQTLSSLADQKASFIMAATSIIFSLSLTMLDKEMIIWALVSLAIFSVIALIYAILTVSPIFKPKMKISPKSDRFNPLFFGHFTQMEYEEYRAYMSDIYDSNPKVCESLVKDLYQIGNVLHNLKYRYLQMSYRAFFLGLVISVLLFVVQISLGYPIFTD